MCIEGALSQGVNCDQILLSNGISKMALFDERHSKEARIPLESFAAVALEIMKTLDDEFLGLSDRKQPFGSFNMMCRASISARTIKRSMQRSAKFWNLFENTYIHRVLTSSGRVYYQMVPRDNRAALNDYAVVSMLSSIQRFHCWLAGQFIPLRAVSLSFPEPSYANEYSHLFYGATIMYGQEIMQVEFETRHTNLEIVQNSETLDSYLGGTNLSLLYQPKHYRVISDQVRQWLEKNIKQGNYRATLKEAAKHFQISQQVLHRRLQTEETSFKDIKMQTRRDISINLLFSGKFKIVEFASKVGFSEPSAFIRAFKSWTGSTPLNYRLKNR
jgi:AraC-like DNA-binding protein